MPRLMTYVLVALVGVLAGGLAMALAPRPAEPIDGTAVRSIVAQMLAEQAAEDEPPMSLAAIDAAKLNPMIEDFLMSNPKVLQRVSVALNAVIRKEERELAAVAINANAEAIFNDPDQIVIGNPEGDVTLVEMFDYNCGYCRSSLPDLLTLLDEDPNLRVVLKEFPILTAGSEEAAKIGVLVGQSEADYLAFHAALFTTGGAINLDSALVAAASVGLDPAALRAEMNSEAVMAILRKSFDLADAIGASGTPTYIIGDELIPGAIGLTELRKRIASMRDCGRTDCTIDTAGTDTPG